MRISQLEIPEVLHIVPEKMVDERGFFARTFCKNELAAVGVDFSPVQSNLSFNKFPFTLRGLHFQTGDAAEAKIVQCLQGILFDVAVDLREDSNTYGKWLGAQLSGENQDMLYIPSGFAHGFFTLSEDVLVHYNMSNFYSASHALGIRWDDPSLAIKWPGKPRVISEKDSHWPLLST